jgi:clan AA aspartic protease
VIQGSVAGLQARIGVIFRLPEQPDIQIECVVDTGFEGALTLPPAAVATLRLPYLTDLAANLADDSSIRTAVYAAVIVWNGVERSVAVLAMGRRPLIGTVLLEGQHLGIDFTDGGAVHINDL